MQFDGMRKDKNQMNMCYLPNLSTQSEIYYKHLYQSHFHNRPKAHTHKKKKKIVVTTKVNHNLYKSVSHKCKYEMKCTLPKHTHTRREREKWK